MTNITDNDRSIDSDEVPTGSLHSTGEEFCLDQHRIESMYLKDQQDGSPKFKDKRSVRMSAEQLLVTFQTDNYDSPK